MTPVEIALLLNTALGIIACALGWRAERRADKNARTAEFFKAHPPLPKIQRVELTDPHPRADAEKEFIRVADIDGKPRTYAFTDASRVQALLHGDRIEDALRHVRARVLKK